MSQDEFLRRLRDADPVDASALPDAASPQARAAYERIVAGEVAPARPRPRRWRVVALSVAAAAAGAAAAVALLTSGSALPALPDRDPPGAVMCVEFYDTTALARRELAFAGTVTTIDGDQITFSVDRWYRGGTADTVTLGGGDVLAPSTSSSVTSLAPAGGESLAIGDEVLVSGDGGFAWPCGFTRFRNQAEEKIWAETFAE